MFGSATLVMNGPGGRVRIEIDAERTTVGRTRDNDIVLQDPAVSGQHCEIKADRLGLLIEDLGSSNGTYVNGRRVRSSPLFDGDALKIGQYKGNIAVRRFDGKPLRPKGAWGRTLAVVAVMLLVLGGLGFGLMHLKERKEADRATFADYEHHAKTLLKDEPCTLIIDQARELALIARELPDPELGRRGRVLTVSQKRVNDDILARSRAREPILAQAVAATERSIEGHKQGIAKLQELAAQFHDVGLATSVRDIETIYARRMQTAEEVLVRLKKHSDQLLEFNTLLERRIATADREAYDLLNGYRFRLEPLKIGAECRKTFQETEQSGFVKLAGIIL